LQTIDRPTSSPKGQSPSQKLAWVVAGLAVLPVLLVAVLTRWGVLIAVVLAVVVGLGIWVWQRGFVFVEIVAFLIHFDGFGAGPIRTGRVMAAIALALLAYKLLSGWRPPAIPVRHWVPIWLLVVWATASGFWSAGSGPYFFALGQLGLGLAFFCVAAMLVESHRMMQQFLRAYWVGGLFGSAAGILALFLGTRSVGFGADPNFFGLLQATMIPLTVYYRRNATTAVARHLYSVTLVIVLAGAAGAGSRSGLIGGAVAIFATMVTRPGLSVVKRGGVAIGASMLAGLAFIVGFVANPNNLQRGFADRGAGRLDTWAVAVALAKENPILGYGFGQLKGLIPPNLLLTPGSLRLNELRPDVSAHNTWLDVQGDLGLIGLVLFAAVFIMALYGLIRPQWLHLREIQTTLLVMMLPVLTGSFFLPLMNNKVAWSLVGMAALLQVPSWSRRWSGLHDDGALATGRSMELVVPGGSEPRVEPQPVVPGERPEVPGEEVWQRVRLARWDHRVNRRSWRLILLGAVVFAVICGAFGAATPTSYTMTAGTFVPRLDGSVGRQGVSVDQQQMQGVLTLAISGAYAAELNDLAGLDSSVPVTRERMFAARPRMGNYIEISYTTTDRSEATAVMSHLLTALDRVYDSTRLTSIEQTENELRPVVPGETRIYTGPRFLPTSEEAALGVQPPRTLWLMFVGSMVGAIAGVGLVMTGQRHPRIRHDDDFLSEVGLPVWARLRGIGRRSRRDADALHQLVATMGDLAPPDQVQRRFVVTSPGSESVVRRAAMALAAELVGRGERVVLVDGRLRRPLLSVRLGWPRRGVAEIADGSIGIDGAIRRVNARRLPRTARRAVGSGIDSLRFVGAGRLRQRRRTRRFPTAAFDRVDLDVAVVVLAPPVLGAAPVTELIGWADAVVLAAEVGTTVTADLEDAAATTRLFARCPAGVVLFDG